MSSPCEPLVSACLVVFVLGAATSRLSAQGTLQSSPDAPSRFTELRSDLAWPFVAQPTSSIIVRHDSFSPRQVHFSIPQSPAGVRHKSPALAWFREPVGGCFRGRPRPPCAGFWLVEAGARRQLAPAAIFREHKIVMAVGWMANRTDRTALGAAGFLITNLDDESRVGVALRIRRWLGPAVALDFGAGPSIAVDADTGGAAGKVGFLVEAGVSVGDWIALFSQVERVPTSQRYGYGDVQWHIGARGGSYVGVAGVVATLVAIAARGWRDAW